MKMTCNNKHIDKLPTILQSIIINNADTTFSYLKMTCNSNHIKTNYHFLRNEIWFQHISYTTSIK